MSEVILAIESSCDETSAAVCIGGVIKSNVIATQQIHSKYGGVVPELASRAHQQAIAPVVMEALERAGVTKADLTAVAFTQGPGLLGALLVGASFAKSLALGLKVPLIAVNHMKAHILAHFIENPKPAFPFLCLTVSGGHTQIVRVDDYLDMTVLGQTKDDAVGEAFDKCAKIMGIPYPGGPIIDKLAKEGDADRFEFSKTDMPDLDYSFSGIKTSFLYFTQNQSQKNTGFVEENKHDLAASIQKHLIGMLTDKLVLAAQREGISNIAIAGGVSANSELRQTLIAMGEQNGWQVFIPKFEYCTDNAAMIAMTAYYQSQQNDTATMNVSPMPRLKF
ncbi:MULTISPECIES: tRNA (adenosine(37)-N6)-threonylcarbamoyltransferase complex transferase subunit TsaD [Reichenbachiella]|uniref:tRNA (adenosine(37)-N6)-threonylcarbamoyltransferase complex transferase subunit TsaD n=1 Tax=Reichenbachiella TaxID=156993 RepID=UPI000E6C43A1|nr:MULTISPECIES: tRNA (adenosine(37)-N6)-threonylcarbamoyltransferase complex transferase subunit TsaD [Reichenbachiella]MBU2913863.1 tRNA (adenosine(37)-N6)-threonylcarbamoyltransferase complex transferase subunit TsaD [Reichenbachiella agariperforans]RJE74219.1 tRNA (adenosine(37)-N6)-threonylcarbamoyltransferase complex transferase subunit TsaD [Reichenbachiella sp. MSK19-1]